MLACQHIFMNNAHSFRSDGLRSWIFCNPGYHSANSGYEFRPILMEPNDDYKQIQQYFINNYTNILQVPFLLHTF